MRRLRQKWWNYSLRKGTQAKVEIVYQTLKDCMKRVPTITGDWYFSGIILLGWSEAE